MARDSYEVYYFQNGRWSVHASFEADGRDEAVAEGMMVESKLGFPARVVKEVFFSETNTTEEAVIWQGAKGKTIADSDNMFGNKPPPAKPGAKKASPPPPPPRPKAEKKPPPVARAIVKKPAAKIKKAVKKEKGFFGKVFTSLLISLAVATAAGAITALSIIYMQSNAIIEEANRTPLIIGAFVMMFFISLLFLLNREFSLLGMVMKSDGAISPQRAEVLQSPMMRKVRARPTDESVEFDQVQIERGQEQVEETPTDVITDSQTEEKALPPELDADMGATTEQPQYEPQQPEQPEPVQQVESAPEPAPEPPAPPKPAPAPEKKAPDVNSSEVEARKIFASFVNQASGSVSRDVGELNAFSRFGMSLLLAGAASSLGQSKKIGREPQLAILKQGLAAVGNTPDRTQTFCAELPGYGKNPRYTGMIQSGSKAMSAYINGDNSATSNMGAIIAEWSKPEKRPTVPSVFTFLFTDIAGSTAMTQQLGNAGAQKVVRAHNTAVRNAIAKVKGREVKHTGDGIMAVFSDSASAANAAIQMQRDIAAHNAANPALPLVVRIGINAGEAVEEENDFFGAAVQMTARICSKARDGHVWASQSVVDACKGQRLGFIPRGKFEMKGIQGARPLYEAAWTEAHKNELADL